jgi:hypothetical protein
MGLRARVGRHFHLQGRQCQNWPDDQRAIIALLNLIPVEDGGAGGALGGRIVSGISSDELYRAILHFEDLYFPGQRSGFVDPDGPMLKRIEDLAARPSSRPNGPPSRNSTPNPARIKALDDWLASITEGHPASQNPWTFYEEVDAYLGPFGEQGYPIGYGKKYCVLFNGSAKLARDPEGRAWVRKTTILLQTYLRQFIVSRYAAGTLATLTEPELRKAAFDSHPLAYTKGGLMLVLVTSPELAVTIAKIPGAEFVGNESGAAWKQFFVTGSLLIPEIVGQAGASMAGPAHTGIFSRAVEQDYQRFLGHQRLADYLDRLRKGIDGGQFDRVVWLERITSQLDQTEFPDRAFKQVANEIVRAADARKRMLAGKYRRDIALSPELRRHYDAYDPDWSNW